MKRLQLILTQDCNSNCSYCMMSKQKLDLQVNIEYVKKIIKEYDIDTLLLFGGEPLIRRDLCIKLHNLCKIKTILPTNGILLTENDIEQYDNILISSNGTKKTCELSGQQFVEKIIHIKNKNKCTIGMRIIPQTVHNFVNDFNYFYNNGFRKFNIMPIVEMNWSNDDLELYKHGVMKIINIIDNIEQIWTWTKGGICVPYMGNICMDQLGNIWPCARYYDSKINMNMSKKIYDKNFKKCINCNLLKYCFHNCSYLSLIKNGSLTIPFKNICKFAKIYKEALE